MLVDTYLRTSPDIKPYALHEQVTAFMNRGGKRDFIFGLVDPVQGVVVIRHDGEGGVAVDDVSVGCRYAFHLIASPVKRVKGKNKWFLYDGDERKEWLAERGKRNGFTLLDVKSSYKKMNCEKPGRNFDILRADFVGVLECTNKDLLAQALWSGIGRGKAFGMGLMRLESIN